MTFRSIAIHSLVAGAFTALLACAVLADGVFAWSIGFACIAYDLVLIAIMIRQLSLPGWRASQSLPLAPLSTAVIVAAHNEAAVLSSTIEAILKCCDPPDQILVADDGSTDATSALFRSHFGLNDPPLGGIAFGSIQYATVGWLRLPHGGKASALNAAVLATSADIVVTVDADTRLEQVALRAIRNAFMQDATVVAVGGAIVPTCHRSPVGIALQWVQSHEYARNLMLRLAFSRLRCLLMISGAFAAFRRDALVSAGGFKTSSLVEDYELIHRIYRHAADHDLNWRMQLIGDAVAHTEAPGTIASFMRQRRRWFAGFLETHAANFDMVGNAHYGRFGTLMLPIKAIDTLQPLAVLAAYGFLILFAVRSQWTTVAAAIAAITAKIAIDTVFDVWSQRVYHRIFPAGAETPYFPAAAALIAPFSFQLLRYAGAGWGWLAFLRGRMDWGGRGR